MKDKKINVLHVLFCFQVCCRHFSRWLLLLWKCIALCLAVQDWHRSGVQTSPLPLVCGRLATDTQARIQSRFDCPLYSLLKLGLTTSRQGIERSAHLAGLTLTEDVPCLSIPVTTLALWLWVFEDQPIYKQVCRRALRAARQHSRQLPECPHLQVRQALLCLYRYCHHWDTQKRSEGLYCRCLLSWYPVGECTFLEALSGCSVLLSKGLLL